MISHHYLQELVEGNCQMFLTTEHQEQFWKDSLCVLIPEYVPQVRLVCSSK